MHDRIKFWIAVTLILCCSAFLGWRLPSYAATSDTLSAKASLNKLSGYFGTAWDSVTDSLRVVDETHSRLHDGDCFTCNFSNATTNATEMTVICFTTPNTTEWTHIVADVTVTHDATFSICEVTSIDVDEGQDLTVYNRNRNSAGISVLLSIENPAVAGGVTSMVEAEAAAANITQTTKIHTETIGQTGNYTNVKGGPGRATIEFILKQNTEYAFIVTDNTADDSTTNIVLNWYEHVNSN